MEEKLKKYEAIINEIQKYYIKKERTFFEITKYPYREKVSSNILAFFFDIKNEQPVIPKKRLNGQVKEIKWNPIDGVDKKYQYYILDFKRSN